MRGLIIGGGIGGLSAAIAFSRVGIPVDVFERASELREVGAGIGLWSNAIDALARLGLEAAVRRAGAKDSMGAIWSWRGKRLAEAAGNAKVRDRLSVIGIHRGDLQKILYTALKEDQVHLGATCIGIRQDDRGIVALFQDGREERGDFLVGADGIHSTVRKQIVDDRQPRYAGHLAWRGVTLRPVEKLAEGEGLLVLGPGSHFGGVHIGNGRFYWFGTRNTPQASTIPEGGVKREVLRQFHGWHAPTEAVIESTEEASILRNDIVDRPPTKHWGKARVTLLGDAAHPMTPFLGQGACQAIEDAVVLADRIRCSSDLIVGLRAYEKARRRRTASLVRQSWYLGVILQLENSFLSWLRDFGIRWTPQFFTNLSLLRVVNHESPDLSA